MPRSVTGPLRLIMQAGQLNTQYLAPTASMSSRFLFWTSSARLSRWAILMVEAQQLFDEHLGPACPSQLTSPVLHRVLSHEPIQPHIYGGKGVGSQGDGTAQFVARSAADRDAAMRIITDHCPHMQCFPLTIVPGMPSMPRGERQ